MQVIRVQVYVNVKYFVFHTKRETALLSHIFFWYVSRETHSDTNDLFCQTPLGNTFHVVVNSFWGFFGKFSTIFCTVWVVFLCTKIGFTSAWCAPRVCRSEAVKNFFKKFATARRGARNHKRCERFSHPPPPSVV